MNKGKIVQVIGPVIDVSFEGEGISLPNILEALEIIRPNGQKIVGMSVGRNIFWRIYIHQGMLSREPERNVTRSTAALNFKTSC